MKDILVVAKLKEGKFEKFMGFMQSEQGMNERKKIADLTKTLGTVSPDKSAVMFKIAVHDEDGLNSFLDGSNPVSKPIFDDVMVSYEIFELNKEIFDLLIFIRMNRFFNVRSVVVAYLFFYFRLFFQFQLWVYFLFFMIDRKDFLLTSFIVKQMPQEV